MTKIEFFQRFGLTTAVLDGKDTVAIVAELGTGTFIQELYAFFQEYRRLRQFLTGTAIA